MKIKMKYSLGDRFVDKTSNAEYFIEEWRAELTDEGLKVFYTFHAYCDSRFDFHQFVEESLMEKPGEKFNWNATESWYEKYELSCDEPHPCEVDVSTADFNGEEIQLDDIIYGGLLYGEHTHPEASARLSGHWSRVKKIRFSQERRHNLDRKTFSVWPVHTDFVVERLGPCYGPDDEPYQDGRHEAAEYTVGNHYVFKTVTDKFVDMYVAALRKAKYERELLLADPSTLDKTATYFIFDCRQVLTHMGILDKVRELVKKRPPRKKTTPKPKPTKKKEVDWEALARKLAAQSGVDIDEMVKS